MRRRVGGEAPAETEARADAAALGRARGVPVRHITHPQPVTRARDGECEKNPDSMVALCPLSCGICTFNCTDTDEHCVSWAQDGQCEENPLMMYKVPLEHSNPHPHPNPKPSPSPSP